MLKITLIKDVKILRLFITATIPADCNCHPKGALNNNCDLYTGECDCAPNVYGLACDECMVSLVTPVTRSEENNQQEFRTISNIFYKTIPWTPRPFQPGSWGLSSYGECQPCQCDPFNSMSLQCDQDSGQCPCYDNIVFTDSRTCSGCPTGQYSNVPGTCSRESDIV